tara:strand:+ start:37 stop:1116 length:1080 start_codon:yes stop_codon:yes gene_type:complete
MQIINKILCFKKVYIFFISSVLFLIIFSTSFLYANNFRVSDIDISSPFDLNFNKNKVIDGGFRKSFINLISMITTSGDKEKIKNTPLKEMKGMIDTFTISNEMFANDEYSANLEVTFDKKKILIFLEQKNIFPSIPVRSKVLLIPILVDSDKDNIFLFNNNIFYQKWNKTNQNYYLLDYLLPTEDLEDLSIIQKNYRSIENYNFDNLIKKYDLKNYIIAIMFKSQNELKVLSKINLNTFFKVDNQIFKDVNLDNQESFMLILEKLKITYENYWKKNNEINTSIKLPLTISINSKDYTKIKKLEKTLNNLDLISKFYISKFDNNNLFFKIIYNGSPQFFLDDMKKNDFNLITEKNIWAVK